LGTGYADASQPRLAFEQRRLADVRRALVGTPAGEPIPDDGTPTDPTTAAST
jgi:hypothetical protein